MARRKADELEDFGGQEQKSTGCSKEEIATGSMLLKKMLVDWRDRVKDKGLGKEEMREELKKLAQEGEYKVAFETDPFFKSVRALA